ncbi:unnamed protein product [Ectocarpus sp. CCAP 1310/34]|nr:unnamed protein product [Ectocarpus sp. CCAP 1310/34]
MRAAAASMDGQQEGDHHQAVAEIVEDDLHVQDALAADVAKDGMSGADTGSMPIADVMVLLQAMREEQLDSLKSIADGVQQLQSQVMVLGESARHSEGKMSLALDRLGRIEIRLDSTTVPMKSQMTVPPKSQQQQQPQPQSRTYANIGAGMGGRMGADGRAKAMKAPQPSSAFGKAAPPPPPATVEDAGRVPTWQGRAEPEPAWPHFMRNASPQQKSRAPSAKSAPATAAATVVPVGGAAAVSAVTPGEASGGGKGEGVSQEEAAKKEAKRLAFMEDRARIQARIAASKGGRAAPASSPKPTPTTTHQSAPAAQDIQAQKPEPFETPSAASAGEGGSFSGSPSFLDSVGGDVGAGAGGGRADDEAEAWLEREREQRGKRERERREEKERVERQLAEAKKFREEEEARKLREAEEARAREKARREAEAKRQAKTRVLMSSLFDKSDEDDSNSLFGGLGGAALPVFHDDDNNGSRAHDTSLAEQLEEKPEAPASSVSEADAPPLPPGFGSGIGGGGGSLFAGMEEPSTGRGGIFEEVNMSGAPDGDPHSSPVGGLSSARQSSSNGVGSGLFPDEEPTPPESRLGAGDGGYVNVDVQPGGYSGLFDSSPPLEGSSSSLANKKAGANSPKATVTTLEGSATGITGASSNATVAATTDGAADEMDDFFSKLEAASVSAPSTGAATTTATRGSLFENDGISGAGDEGDDDIFSSSYTGVTGGTGGDSTQSRGNKGALFDPSDSQSAGTSLFDRMEFSIDAGDPAGGNVFGGGGVSGGGRGIGDASASFLSAMGDVDLMMPSGDDGVEGEVGGEADKEGMTEVSL